MHTLSKTIQIILYTITKYDNNAFQDSLLTIFNLLTVKVRTE